MNFKETITDVHTPELYHQHVQYTLKNSEAALVKMADFTDNLMTVYVSSDQKWKDELWRRYFPIIPLFEKAFLEHECKENLSEFFAFIQED